MKDIVSSRLYDGAERIAAKRDIELMPDAEMGGRRVLVGEDGEDGCLVFIEVRQVAEFEDGTEITRTQFEDSCDAYIRKHGTLGARHGVRLDCIQFRMLDGPVAAVQVRYIENQTRFADGDEEVRLLKRLLAMTLAANSNTDVQTELAASVRCRLAEIKERAE